MLSFVIAIVAVNVLALLAWFVFETMTECTGNDPQQPAHTMKAGWPSSTISDVAIPGVARPARWKKIPRGARDVLCATRVIPAPSEDGIKKFEGLGREHPLGPFCFLHRVYDLMDAKPEKPKKKRKKLVKRGLPVQQQVELLDRSIAKKQKTIAKHEIAIRRLEAGVKKLLAAKRAREAKLTQAKEDTRVLRNADFTEMMRERRARGEIKDLVVDTYGVLRAP